MADLQPQKKVFCRLCGCDCQNNVCVDLSVDLEHCGDSDTEKLWHYTIKKLARLNILIADSDEPWLPTTVCFVCEKRLSDAYDFVLQAESVSDSLRLLYDTSVKIEDIDETFDQPVTSDDTELETDFSIDQEHVVEEPEINTGASDDNSEIHDDVYMSNDIIEQTNSDDTELETDFSMDQEHVVEEIEMNTNASDDNSETHDIYMPNDIIEQTNGLGSTFLDSDDDYEEKFEPLTYTWADYSWSCLFCVNQFPTFEEFREHSITQHNVCNAYECMYCDKASFCLKQYLQHIRSHAEYLRGNCYLYKENTTDSAHFNIHKSKFMCPGCQTGFNSLEEKTLHVKQYCIRRTYTPYTPLVRQLSDNLTCCRCETTCDNVTELKTHIVSCHIKQHFLCDICGILIQTESQLRAHITDSHSNLLPICKICNKKFRNRINLKKHIKLHSEEYLYTCNECGKGYKSRGGLTDHIESHKDEGTRRYKCSECPKSFRRKGGLKIHIRQHTGERPYLCTECNKTFVNRPNLGKHMKRIHKVELLPKKSKVLKQVPEEIAKWKEEVFKKTKSRYKRKNIYKKFLHVEHTYGRIKT